MSSHDLAYTEPEKIKSIDAEFLAGHGFPYQEDMSLVEDIDLMAATRVRTSTGSRTSRSSRRTACPPCSTYSNASSRSTSRSPRARGRDRAEGAREAPDERELVPGSSSRPTTRSSRTRDGGGRQGQEPEARRGQSVTICHASGNGKYVQNSPDVDSIVSGQGHGGHPEDIVRRPRAEPKPGESGSYPGQNSGRRRTGDLGRRLRRAGPAFRLRLRRRARTPRS